ncbi:MAG: helix-turn-helix domain-containing protein [Stenotrophobium sp.]
MSALKSQDIKPLCSSVSECLDDYFAALNGHAPKDLYDTILGQVEPPLLNATLIYCEGNQSRAADMLGLNRATLRKKLKQYKIKPQSS